MQRRKPRQIRRTLKLGETIAIDEGVAVQVLPHRKNAGSVRVVITVGGDTADQSGNSDQQIQSALDILDSPKQESPPV